MSGTFDIIAWGVTFLVGYLMGKGSAKMDFAEKLYFPELKNRYDKWRDKKEEKNSKLID